MEYVIKNYRLRDYLYTLGFNYRSVLDKTGKQDFVYLFQSTKELLEAITYYSEFKNNKVSKKITPTKFRGCDTSN